MDLLSDLVKLYKDSEAPEIFFYWAGISAISAVSKKNVYLNRGGHYCLVPNIFCFLVAESGMRKGMPIRMAKKLVEGVNNTRIISGRNSVQSVIEELGKAITFEGGGIARDAHAYLVSSELAGFLIKDTDALSILTDLYDVQYNEKEWKYNLKSGHVTLREPCISMFAATNEENFTASVSSRDTYNGFIARTFIVYSTEQGAPNALVDEGEKIDLAPQIEIMKEIGNIKGEFKWTKEAGDYYKQWYIKYNSIKHQDPTGTCNRMGDSILKVAMCIGLARMEFPNITLRAIKESIARCLATLTGMKQVVMGGPQSLAAQTKLVIRELIIAPDHTIDRKSLLAKNWGHFDSFDLDRIAETLNQAGAIEVHVNGKGTLYTMKAEAYEAYMNYKKAVN